MVIVVMGVSGSGKTDVGGTLAKRLGWVFEDAIIGIPLRILARCRAACPSRMRTVSLGFGR